MGEAVDRMTSGEWYLDEPELGERRRQCWRLLDRFNTAAADEDDVRDEVLAKLLAERGDGATVVPRFRCSYGFNITLGAGSFVNAEAFFMDDAAIVIGKDVRIGPGAHLMTALHPVDDHEMRRAGWERALPIEIGENAWLGAGVTVGAGVRIGPNTVVGAGSVVLHDLPDHVVAAGSPAVVVRETRG